MFGFSRFLEINSLQQGMGSEAGSRIFFPWLRIQALAPHYPEINQNLPVKTEPVTAGTDDTVYVR